MKKLSYLLLITACTTLFNCSPEETNSTESNETTKVTTEVSETVVESSPSTAPTPTPTENEIKLVFSEVLGLKTEFEKAIQEKNLGSFQKAKEKWEEQEKSINTLIEKYGAESFHQSPAGDCRRAFYQMFQAYVVFWDGATDPSSSEEKKRAYQEDKDKFLALFNECKLSSETGKRAMERNQASNP